MTRFVSILAVAFVLSSLVACGRSATRVQFDRELSEVMKIANKGQFAEAARAMERLAERGYLRDDPVQLRLRAANLWVRANQDEEAIRILDSLDSRELNREDGATVLLRRARIVARRSEAPASAEAIYRALIVDHSATVAGHVAVRELRILLLDKQDLHRWKSVLEELIVQTEGTSVEGLLLYHHARVYREMKNEPEAVKLLERLHTTFRASKIWRKASKDLAAIYRSQERFQDEASVLLAFERKGGTSTPIGMGFVSLSKRGELRLAALMCGPLKTPEGGIRRMRKFGKRHKKSSLKDDALWQLAVCYREAERESKYRSTLCKIIKNHSLTRHARRARKILGLPIGPGPGGSGAKDGSTNSCSGAAQRPAISGHGDAS